MQKSKKYHPPDDMCHPGIWRGSIFALSKWEANYERHYLPCECTEGDVFGQACKRIFRHL
jgi:hypothetical protein